MKFLSVLMPSRGRPYYAKEAIKSFKPSRETEFLIAVDDDDPYLAEYKKMKDIAKVIVTPRYGYGQLHEYFNLLAKESKGRWLMLFNDDAVVEDMNYLQLAKYDNKKPAVLNVWNEQDNLFPLISRKMYEIMGHFSLSPHADSWVAQVGTACGIQYYTPGFDIKHNRDRMNDSTFLEGREAIKTTAPAFNSREMEALKEADINKIKEYMACNP